MRAVLVKPSGLLYTCLACLRCGWTIIERAGLSILTHWAEVSAELISLSKPHEYWCSHEHADIYTGMKSKCGHICEAVVFSVNARAGIFVLLRCSLMGKCNLGESCQRV